MSARTRTRTWSDLSRQQKTALMVAASMQVSLALTAWIDLARRPATEVNGSKARWAAIIGVNFVGPLSYFRWGRRHGASANLAASGSRST